MIIRNLLMVLHLCFCSEAYKILVFYPFPTLSHHRGILALTERLITDGHELYVVSPFGIPGLKNHENYTFVDLSPTYTLNNTRDEAEIIDTLQQRISKWEMMSILKDYPSLPQRALLSDTYLQFKRRVESESIKFDLVIAEMLFFSYACAMTRDFPGSGPLISMSSITSDVAEDSLGSIKHYSFFPLVVSRNTDRMNLWQRLENWIAGVFFMSWYINKLDAAVRVYLHELYGPGSEDTIGDCWSRNSLSLIASNSLYAYPRLLGPNVIEVGPLHLKTPEKLPQNLQDWLDGAEKGVIYFSMGCTKKGKSLPAEIRGNFLKVFKELPPGYRVLWKWELDGKIPGQSDNILPQKWLPQMSVLAHPKLKVFIMQGGLQSFQEAVHYGVPIVGIPWSVDQESSVAKIVDAGIGVRIEAADLDSFEKIKSALEAVLHDRRYSNNMKKLSAISHDFTSRGLDQAVFWIEHVAKHGGASHLRPATADTTLFEFFCLDIISLIILLSFLILYVAWSLGKFLHSIVLKQCRNFIEFRMFGVFRKANSKLKSS